MSNKDEVRSFKSDEFRASVEEHDGKRFLVGEIPYDSLSQDLGGFREIITRSAFNKTLADNYDVKALVNHDDSKILGRVKNGTLKLEQTDRSLRCTVEIGSQSYATDLWESIKRDDVNTMSFGFRMIKDDWKQVEGKQVRYLNEAHLFEISLGVTFPAYEETNSFTMYRSLYKDAGLNFDSINAALLKLKSNEDLSDEEVASLKAISELVKSPEEPVKEEEPRTSTLSVLEQELDLLERSI